MKSLRLVLALVFIVAVIAACSAMQEKDLIGAWQAGGSGTIEFTKDGKLNVAGGPATISAACGVQDKGSLQVDLGILGTATLKYVLDKDSLTITDAKGKSVKYTRVKEVKPEAPKAKAEAPKAKAEAPKAKAEAPKAQAEAPKAHAEPPAKAK